MYLVVVVFSYTDTAFVCIYFVQIFQKHAVKLCVYALLIIELSPSMEDEDDFRTIEFVYRKTYKVDTDDVVCN